MREDEQRATIRTTEDDVDRALRHIDLRNLHTGGVEDEYLPVGNVHVASFINGNALATPIGKGLQIAERAIFTDHGAGGAVFRRTADVNALAGDGANEAIGIEIVGEAPARGIRGPLLEYPAGGQEHTAIRGNILPP